MKMKKRIYVAGIAVMMMFGIASCGVDQEAQNPKTEKIQEEKTTSKEEETEIQVFIAASLNTVMTDIAKQFQAINPNVKITFNADSSGTLLTQIEEGYECDIFFSAAQKQMDQLEADQLIAEESRANVVNNKVVLVSLKDSQTKVTSLSNLQDAESVALAGGSVPVGKYTRQALINLGILEETDEPDAISTKDISDVLGGVEISEQDNVSKVLSAVAEGACEVGTTYYSDTYGYEDKLKIIEEISCDLTGNIIYPVCLVTNEEADQQQTGAARDFYEFILSDQAKEIFALYYFDTDVER